MTATYRVSDAELEAYANDGALLLKSVIDAPRLAQVAEAIERDIDSPGPFCHGYEADNGRGRFHGNLRIWENDKAFREFCFASGLPEIAAQFFGSSRVNLLYDQLFVKEPGTPNRTRWHNDQPYWPVRGWHVMSFWLALDPTTAENGRLEFVRGSHRWDRWFQPEAFGKRPDDDRYSGYALNPDYETMPDIESNRDAYEIIAWDMQPGDVIAFHGLSVHGAGGNHRDDLRRRGYTVRYTGDEAWYDARVGTSGALLSDELADGDPIGGTLYPLLWERGATQ